jgi:hypothetical protein
MNINDESNQTLKRAPGSLSHQFNATNPINPLTGLPSNAEFYDNDQYYQQQLQSSHGGKMNQSTEGQVSAVDPHDEFQYQMQQASWSDRLVSVSLHLTFVLELNGWNCCFDYVEGIACLEQIYDVGFNCSVYCSCKSFSIPFPPLIYLSIPPTAICRRRLLS